MCSSDLKIKNKKNFEVYEPFDIEWVISNNFENYDVIERSINLMINSLDKSWAEQTTDDKTYSLDFTDILDSDKFYNHLRYIATLLNQSITQSKDEFVKDHAMFLSNQPFLNSYYRHISKTWNDDVILDRLMKKFVD